MSAYVHCVSPNLRVIINGSLQTFSQFKSQQPDDVSLIATIRLWLAYVRDDDVLKFFDNAATPEPEPIEKAGIFFQRPEDISDPDGMSMRIPSTPPESQAPTPSAPLTPPSPVVPCVPLPSTPPELLSTPATASSSTQTMPMHDTQDGQTLSLKRAHPLPMQDTQQPKSSKNYVRSDTSWRID